MNRQTLDLPSLEPIPDDIDEHIRRLLRTHPPEPALEEWLTELIKHSGHMSLGQDMRWRLLSIIWLAQFDPEKAWPYLMWLNMNEPVIQDHLAEILTEAVDDLEAHVQLANWMNNPPEERLATFFSQFRHIPALSNIPSLLKRLLARPAASETGVWLAGFCRNTAGHLSPSMRRWHLLAAAWYATRFDPEAGLAYLRESASGADTLSASDNKLLMEAASEIAGVNDLIQWIADCSDPAVKTMLREFGHPDLPTFTKKLLQKKPDYSRLADLADQARADAQAFQRYVSLLRAADIPLEKVKILDLACGLLAPQTVLFNSAGYKTVGADLHIPPAYLPLPGLLDWFKRTKHKKAWQEATGPYYQALSRESGLKLKWNRVKIELADLTRLQFADSSFDIVICLNYLQHAPDVAGLLAEAARVLAPNGILLADFRPYPALSGAFQIDGSLPPWDHLRDKRGEHAVALNQWREARYRTAFEQYLAIDQWLAEQEEQAQARLTPDIQAELADYSPEELTRQQITVLARKAT